MLRRSALPLLPGIKNLLRIDANSGSRHPRFLAPASGPSKAGKAGASLLSTSVPFDFESESEETLDSVCERLEDLLQDAPGMEDADVTLASGVLTAELPGHGTYVINKQSPNRQIWLSSPLSGPARFGFDPAAGAWVYDRTGESLHTLLDREIGGKILKVDSKFREVCHLGGASGGESG